MDQAKKRVTIVVSLVPEADVTDNEEIKKQIREESSIPFCAQIEKVYIFKESFNIRKRTKAGKLST